MNTDELLAERQKTHGDFTERARITQHLKDVMRQSEGWSRLDEIHRESLEMWAHKVGRILAGDPNEPDHWDDIAGYARLVSQRLIRHKTNFQPLPEYYIDKDGIPRPVDPPSVMTEEELRKLAPTPRQNWDPDATDALR